MKCKVAVIVAFFVGLFPSAFAAELNPEILEESITKIVVVQTKSSEFFTAQFAALRQQYPSYQKQLTALELAHAQLVKATRESLTLAHHHFYFLYNVTPALTEMYVRLEEIPNTTLREVCITLLNHPYAYSTVRDTPSTYTFKANLKHISKAAIIEQTNGWQTKRRTRRNGRTFTVCLIATSPPPSNVSLPQVSRFPHPPAGNEKKRLCRGAVSPL